jgi:4-amino-4-deoxy-L-arabinose transferase-like glycosyltransferase
MNSLLLAITVVALVATIGLLGLVPEDATGAILIVVPLATIAGFAISRFKEDEKFLISLFFSAVAIRLAVGTAINVLHGQAFFGGDANTFDSFGYALVKTWEGDKYYQTFVDLFSGGGSGSGWGMLYMVAVIYKIVGRNMLAVQYANAVLGAATAPIAYLIAMEIFPNRKVGRACGILAAFFPSLVLWTSQGLKDGPIIFLLTLSMFATLKLGNRFSYKYVAALSLALCGLITLRFYVFYIIAIAITAAFVLGRRQLTAKSFARQFVILGVVGLVLVYFGVSHYASKQYEAYGNFQQLQAMRLDASQSARSGFGQDIDVSTPEGVLSAIPIGLAYLILAPFPWQFTSPRQMITLPEMLIWWSSLPLLVFGMWFTIKHRLREIAPILIFTTLLTLAYSIVQGNVGTAYRQRAQLLIFYFVFVAVGYGLLREKRAQKTKKAVPEPKEPRLVKWTPGQPERKDRMPVAG